MEIRERLAECGLTETQYEEILRTCSDKIEGVNDYEWQDIVDKFNLNIHRDVLRKAQSANLFGGYFVKKYLESKGTTDTANIDNKIQELRKERIKLQTANVERSRIDRNEARHEMYYEQIGALCQSLPLPQFKPRQITSNDDIEHYYLVTLSDMHYGAKFQSENNEYSPEIFKDRLEYLFMQLIDFVERRGVKKLWIAELGDSLQGLIHLTDLKINDTSVVRAVVDFSRIIATFLNELSEYVDIEYVHVPSANHTQTRPLGTRSSELADEDLEYVIGHYISDLVKDNPHIEVKLADEGKQYVKIDIPEYNIYALHGHQIKDVNNSVKNLSALIGKQIDTLIMGHYHSGKEIPVGEGLAHDIEVLVCPSFIGSDPYADKLMCGSKGAVKIYGFDEINGHTESYKIILN